MSSTFAKIASAGVSGIVAIFLLFIGIFLFFSGIILTAGSWTSGQKTAGIILLVIGSICLLGCVSLCVYIIKVVKNTKIDSGPHIQSGVVHVSL